MSLFKFFSVALIACLLCSAGLQAQSTATSAQKTPVTPTPQKDIFTFLLPDDSKITGMLSMDVIVINTKYGTLKVPITDINSIRPGLNARTGLVEKTHELLNALEDANFYKREEAQSQLIELGPAIYKLLQNEPKDSDPERASRLEKIIEAIDEMITEAEEAGDENGQVLDYEDKIVTDKFTIIGAIEQSNFEIKSKYGVLATRIDQISSIKRKFLKSQLRNKTVAVPGGTHAQMSYIKTGLTVKKGDKLTLTATGQITMTPWGNNRMSTPDGNMQQYGKVNIGGMNLPVGALVAKIGNHPPILIGSKHNGTAKHSGKLQLAIVGNPSYFNYQYPGEYKVRVRVAGK